MISNEIHSNVFKHCENAVRGFYGHKRKLNTVNINLGDESEYELRIAGRVKEIIARSTRQFAPLDDKTEIELNAQNPTRWKIKFGELTANYAGDAKRFVEEVLRLGKLNRNNPSVETIFFEASKFISKSDKEAALSLYVYYLHYDLKSASFENKQLTKTVQKNLFETDEQFRDFEILVEEFISDGNLEKALQKIPAIYAVKRKKIRLDGAAVKAVERQHSGTVELLNEFLQDDNETEAGAEKPRQSESPKVEIGIIQKDRNLLDSVFTDQIAFTEIHREILEIFSKNNLALLQTDLELFAKSRGAFKNRLIDSLNEICYELLDDVLVEEAGDYYTINENYYRKLVTK